MAKPSKPTIHGAVISGKKLHDFASKEIQQQGRRKDQAAKEEIKAHRTRTWIDGWAHV